MKPAPERDWNPDPQLLAAYFDGELEGCADRAELRARVEAWLGCHRESLALADEYRRLRKILHETAPAEPDDQTWRMALDHIDAARCRPSPRPVARSRWLGAATCAAAIALVLGSLFGVHYWSVSPPTLPPSAVVVVHPQPRPWEADEAEVFPVAAANDVLIVRVDGQDTESLVVGELPMHGPMELAAPGEVRVFVARPDERDRVPQVRQDGSNRPMIYVRFDSDRE